MVEGPRPGACHDAQVDEIRAPARAGAWRRAAVLIDQEPDQQHEVVVVERPEPALRQLQHHLSAAKPADQHEPERVGRHERTHARHDLLEVRDHPAFGRLGGQRGVVGGHDAWRAPW